MSCQAAIFIAASCLLLWSLSHPAGVMVASASMGMQLLSGAAIVWMSIQRERQHGTDRRADTEVHSDPDDGTTTVTFSSGGVTVFAGTVTWLGDRRSEPRTVERTGIRLGEVEGYRAWRLAGPVLTSFNGVPWLPGQLCEGPGLNENNHAGVHAWKTLEQAQDYACDEPPAVVGKVKLWGEIIEHELGYRGEFAKPCEMLSAFLNCNSFGDAEPVDDEIGRIVLAEVARLYGLPNGRALED